MAEDSFVSRMPKTSVTIDGVTTDVVAASFRGIPFFVSEHTSDGIGRTIVSKKIPYSSEYEVEDIGGSIPTHTMEFYLVGDDCDVQMQDLVNACNAEDVGELVHPWLGSFEARCTGLRYSSNRNELGYISGTVSFVQISSLPVKSVAASDIAETKSEANGLIDFAKNAFNAVIDGMAKVGKAWEQVADLTNDVLDVISEARRGLMKVSEFVGELGKIKANVGVLLKTPQDFSARIENLIATTEDIFGLTSSKSETIELVNIVNNADNTNPSGSLVQRLSVAQVALSAVSSKYESVDEAISMQGIIDDMFERILENCDDFVEYNRLASLRSSCLSYIRNEMANVSQVVEVDVTNTQNVLQLCYDVYGDLDKVDDIMSRNFLSQGLLITPKKVKVLSR